MKIFIIITMAAIFCLGAGCKGGKKSGGTAELKAAPQSSVEQNPDVNGSDTDEPIEDLDSLEDGMLEDEEPSGEEELTE